MNQKSILTIVPSRKRPELLAEMMASFVATRSPENDLVVYVSKDDPRYDDYARSLPWPERCLMVNGPRQYISHTYNMFAEQNPQYDYYAPLNDDHFCITPGWDRKLVELLETKSRGWGCAMAADKLTDWDKYPHPSGCVVSKKTIDALGFMFYPKLHHIGNDVIMGKLFLALGILHGAKDVMIEHRHWVNGIRPMDDNYKWVYGREEQEYGNKMVMDYLYTQYNDDFKKLKEAMTHETH